MTQSIILKPVPEFANAIACVLGDAAKAIRKFGVATHNRCPWVVYVNQLGRVCSQFLERAKFSGYDYQFNSTGATVTNLETGKKYQVLFGASFYCSCDAFRFSPAPKQPCKHLRLAAELRGDLVQAVAQQELERDIESCCNADWKTAAKELKISLDYVMPGMYVAYYRSRKLGTIVEKLDTDGKSWWKNRRQATMLRTDDGDRKLFSSPHQAAIALAEFCRVIDTAEKAKADLFCDDFDF